MRRREGGRRDEERGGRERAGQLNLPSLLGREKCIQRNCVGAVQTMISQ